MSNGDGTPPLPVVNVSLVAGSATSPAGGAVLESWSVTVTAAGWSPTAVTLNSTVHPPLSFGGWYWVVAASDDAPPADAVWCESNTLAFGATTTAGGAWQAGGSGNAAAVTVTVAALPMAPRAAVR